MKFSKLIMAILLVSIVLILGSCNLFNLQPEARFSVQAAQYLNPNVYGTPSPVVLSFYELKTPYPFKSATFFQLSRNAAAVLGESLIDKQTVEIRPKSHQHVSEVLSPNTRYIGIIAAYRNLDHAVWRKVIKLNPKQKNISISINLESQSLVVNVER